MISNPDTLISENFKWKEVVVSSSFPHLAEKTDPTDTQKQTVYQLINAVLQSERDTSYLRDTRYYQTKITSGICSLDLNNALERSILSDHHYRHYTGAIDFIKVDNNMQHSYEATYAAYCWIREHCQYSFGQLIWYWEKGHVHVSVPSVKHKFEVFTTE